MNKNKANHRVCQLKYLISHSNSGFETHLPPMAIKKFACLKLQKMVGQCD